MSANGGAGIGSIAASFSSSILRARRIAASLSRVYVTGSPFPIHLPQAKSQWNKFISAVGRSALAVLQAHVRPHVVSDFILELNRTVAWIRQVSAAVQAAEWRKSKSDWSALCESALEGGARLAHRLCRPPDPFIPDLAPCDDEGMWSGHPSSVLKREVQKWGAIWGASHTKPKDYGQDITLMPPTLMGRPTPGDQIARVARSFKELTCKPDGLHPRYFGWLSEAALEVVSLLFFLIDAIGDFPTEVQNVLIRLLDKPTGVKGQWGSLGRCLGFGLN